MVHKPEKTPWLPKVTPPEDLTRSIMDSIYAEPTPSWDRSPSPIADAQVKKHRPGSYIALGLGLAVTLYLLLPLLPTTIWLQVKVSIGQLVQASRIVKTSLQALISCIAYLITLVQPLLVITTHMAKTWVNLLQIATGPLLFLSLIMFVLTILGNTVLIRILTRQPLLRKS